MTKPAKKEPKMTPKRIRFCHEYVIDFNGQKAAERAGFAKKGARVYACEILQIPAVQELIAKLAKEAQEKADVDAVYVLKGAKEMFERCMQREQVTDSDGVPTGEYKFDSAGAGKALKIMGEHVDVCAFKPKDDDGKPIDQNWRVTIVDAKTGARKVIEP